MRSYILILFFGTLLACHAQDGKETVVTFPDGSKDIERDFRYPGGKDAFYGAVVDNFIVPKQARKDKVSGKIILKITIDSLGVAKGEIVSGLREDVDRAALEMVKKLKKSQPARQGKRNVAVPLLLPLQL